MGNPSSFFSTIRSKRFNRAIRYQVSPLLPNLGEHRNPKIISNEKNNQQMCIVRMDGCITQEERGKIIIINGRLESKNGFYNGEPFYF